MASLPNLSGLSLGGGKEELDTGVVVARAEDAALREHHCDTAFSQLLPDCPVRLLGFRDGTGRVAPGNRFPHKSTVLELGLSLQTLREHFLQGLLHGRWPGPGLAPQPNDDDFVQRWASTFRAYSLAGVNKVLQSVAGNLDTQLAGVRPLPATTPAVGYSSPMEGVMITKNEMVLMSTKKPQSLGRRGQQYSMATYNELWYLNTKKVQQANWPALKTQLQHLVGYGRGERRLDPRHADVLNYLKRCRTDLVEKAKNEKPLYLYGGNATQDTLQNNYRDLDPNVQGRRRAFLFARRSANENFLALGEVLPVLKEVNAPDAEMWRAQRQVNAALANQDGSLHSAQVLAAARSYLTRVQAHLQESNVAFPWFTLELQQVNFAQMAAATDWQALSLAAPPSVPQSQQVADKIFAYLAPPADINTNPMFGDASMTVPWPDPEEEGEIPPWEEFAGLSLDATIRKMEGN